ncbi:MAG: c-type cytochrome [Planctomycetaceae bacterium]|nr:c-type cytochrome [Planctomycetaceae bacterium]
MPANDQFWRPLGAMHKVFAASAVLLLVCTLWMMANDHRDEWREYQTVADKLKAAQLSGQLEEIQTDAYKERQQQLEKQRSEAQGVLAEKSDEIEELKAKVTEIQGDVDFRARQTKFEGAKRDVARANLDIGVRDGVSDEELQVLQEKFDALQASVDGMNGELDVRKAELARAKGDLAGVTAELDEIDTELKKLQTDSELVDKALTSIQPDSSLQKFKRWLMLQPIVDGFNSPHRLQQDWLPNLMQTLGMTKTARFDRCRSCHVNINDFRAGNVPGFPHGDFADGKYPHPYSSHPNPDVYLSSTSPHPMPKFGCTICHDGDGSGTSFQNAEHTPNDPAEAELWSDEHHWHSNHFWEYPMQPDRFIESGCLKCHHSVVELGVNKKFGATAPKVYEGYELIKSYGCFGCHEINGYNGPESIGPDLRLEPQTPEEFAKYADDPNQIPGRERKVGPSLRNLASKTTPEFVAYWTENPSRFRPTTKMPQFFHLTNQQDELAEKYQPVQIAAIAAFLEKSSMPLELMQPQDGYEPDAERGKTLFARRGCLACHSHGDEAFSGSHATFGPELSKVHEKILPGKEGFNWLYTWIREPTRHHPRTKMPNLYLEPEGEGENYVDPAADIAAFLLQGGPKEFPELSVDENVLDELVELFARKGLTGADYDTMLLTHAYPRDPATIKGDEIELARREGDPEQIGEEEWRKRKMAYVGRRTISFYGCYGCHDIPGFEAARPIGTALQDWGRKETSKLALEHIEEFLHHHGTAPAHEDEHSEGGESIPEIAENAIERQFNDGNASEEDLSTAYFYENLLHHGRPGFIWQKLRQPRSYDYMKIETKGYDERLKMPKFPFDQQQIEAVATFVLGLTAEPPAEEYVFHPDEQNADIIEGERLLAKYNCTGCHMLELPEIKYGVDPDDLAESTLGAGDYEKGLELLLQLKPPRNGLTGEKLPTGEPVVSFHGMIFAEPDFEEDPEYQEYSYDLWETLQVGDKQLFPGSKMLVPATQLVEQIPARGGDFAQWLVPQLMESQTGGNRFLAWQASPPPLYLEGPKVQTPWLYRFLKNPEQLRYTTVLRMPQFNMSDDEAMSLANYFAAFDDVPYPYQLIPQQEPPYLSAMQAQHPEGDYLDDAWKMLNAPLCMKCHAVGGNPYKSTDPKKDIRGPNLDRVAKRLRPDWMELWLYKPAWITPYTSMPTNFPKNQTQFPELFGGDGSKQTIAVRDALLNYYDLMEAHGSLAYKPPGADDAAPAGDAGAGGE